MSYSLVPLERWRRQSDQLVIELIVGARLDARARELCQGDTYERLEADVLARRTDPWAAADEMLAGLA